MTDTLEFAPDQSGVSRVECRYCGRVTEYFRYNNGVWQTVCPECQLAISRATQYRVMTFPEEKRRPSKCL